MFVFSVYFVFSIKFLINLLFNLITRCHSGAFQGKLVDVVLELSTVVLDQVTEAAWSYH